MNNRISVPETSANVRWLRVMRIVAFSLGALFLVCGLIESLWNPFEHSSDKFLAATGIALVFLGITRREREEKEDDDVDEETEQ